LWSLRGNKVLLSAWPAYRVSPVNFVDGRVSSLPLKKMFFRSETLCVRFEAEELKIKTKA
jgi:hypothetical protein